MSHPWLSILFAVSTLYFGVGALPVVPTLLKLLIALATGRVKWPGPRIHDPTRRSQVRRERLGTGYEQLFSTFIFNALGGIGGFVFSLSLLISMLPSMRGRIWIDWKVATYVLVLLAFIGGRMGFKKARKTIGQVDAVLSDVTTGVEPRLADGRSARSAYAIEHPLLDVRTLSAHRKQALNLFYESVRCHQDGDEFRALALYNAATKTDLSLHENAREALSGLAEDCRVEEAGPINYWLGIHSEWLHQFVQAAGSYEKAVRAFEQIGHNRRASRACNNLGSVRARVMDPSAMASFEKAIALDPQNGMAHISVGVIYYRTSDPGEPGFEKALDAFADAIAADPEAYTPVVASHLRRIGYTWQEDLEEISERAQKKLTQADSGGGPGIEKEAIRPVGEKKRMEVDTGAPTEETAGLTTYRDKTHGFEMELPEDWSLCEESVPVLASALFRIVKGWTPHVDVAFTRGPDEILNVVVESMDPEPPPQMTEFLFRQYARNEGFTDCVCGRITIANKAHTWARYRVGSNLWSKKYLVVLGGKGYAVTATCKGTGMFSEREKVWDQIAKSLRVRA